ncbi:MAG: hypothetical protein K6G04_00255 [Lachnospiraceae bacterium]|jgi:hypothetical protein|nr:hypothetical protein [Lachnospiraceae bacterium]
MLKKVCAFLLIIILLPISITVNAQESQVSQNYIEDQFAGMEPDAVVAGEDIATPTSFWEKMKNIIRLKGNSVTCCHALKIYDSQKTAMAESYTQNGYMDVIDTLCTAYGPDGWHKTDHQRLDYGKVYGCNASVSVPNGPLPLRISSAYSTHTFTRAGYNGVNETHSWYE